MNEMEYRKILKKRIQEITIDDLINFDIEYTTENLNQKLTEFDKTNIKDCWDDSEDSFDLIKKYIVEKILN